MCPRPCNPGWAASKSLAERNPTGRLTFLLLVMLLLPLTLHAGLQKDDEEDDFEHFGELTEQDIVTDDSPHPREIVHPDWFKLSFLDLRDDLEEAREAGKKGIIIYFGQKNCPYCQALMEKDFGKEDIARYTQKNFDVIALDIWGNREVTDVDGKTYTERQFAKAKGAFLTPTLLFYDTNGREALKLVGFYPPFKFRAALAYVAEGFYHKESLHDFMQRAENRPPRFDENGLNEEPFFLPPPHIMDRSRIPARRPLVVFFEQPQCHTCDILHAGPLQHPDIRELLDEFDAVQLDITRDEKIITPDGKRTTARDWARQLDVFYTPTLIFFDEHGKQVLRIESLVQLYRLRKILEYVLEKGYEIAPLMEWH